MTTMPGSWAPGDIPPSHPLEKQDAHAYLHTQLLSRRPEYLSPLTLRVSVGCWNTGNFDCASDLKDWLCLDLPRADIYALALQEVVDVNNTQNFLRYVDPKIALNWAAHAQSVLPSGYECVAQTQLIGMLLLVFISPDIKGRVGSVATSTIGTGLMGYVGNKGGVGVRIVLGETLRLVFVNCHLAAFANAVDRRNWDAAEIHRRMTFEAVSKEVVGLAEENTPIDQQSEGIDKADVVLWCGDLNYRIELENEDVRALLEPYMPKDLPPTHADMKSPTSPIPPASPLNGPGTEGEKPPSPPLVDGTLTTLQGTLRSILKHDQLCKVRREGKALVEYRESKIEFLPTYKYDVGTLGVWDSSEKARAPSWCDRVLWKVKAKEAEKEAPVKEENPVEGEKAQPEKSRGENVSVSSSQAETLFEQEDDEDEDLVVSRAETPIQGEPQTPTTPRAEKRKSVDMEPLWNDPISVYDSPFGEVKLEQHLYTSHQTITTSDHKPVSAEFSLTFPAVVADLRHKIHAEIAREVDKLENERRPLVTVLIDPPADEEEEEEEQEEAKVATPGEENVVVLGDVRFWEEKRRSITVANTGATKAIVHFVARPAPGGSGQEIIAKPWLELSFPDQQDPEKGLTLEPGESCAITITLCISTAEHVRLLNSKSEVLDDVLILRVDDGRDTFLPVSATWQPTCYSTPLEDLVRIPEGTGGFRAWKLQHPDDQGMEEKPLYSSPRELYRLSDFLLTTLQKVVADLGPDEDIAQKRWYATPGWPFATASTSPDDHRRRMEVEIWNATDTDTPFPASPPLEDILESAASVLLSFLAALPTSIVPDRLWDTVVAQGAADRDKVLDALPPVHANVFLYFCGFVGEVVRVLAERRPVAERERVLVAVVGAVAPKVVRRPGRVLGMKAGAEERTRKWFRRFVEM